MQWFSVGLCGNKPYVSARSSQTTVSFFLASLASLMIPVWRRTLVCPRSLGLIVELIFWIWNKSGCGQKWEKGSAQRSQQEESILGKNHRAIDTSVLASESKINFVPHFSSETIHYISSKNTVLIIRWNKIRHNTFYIFLKSMSTQDVLFFSQTSSITLAILYGIWWQRVSELLLHCMDINDDYHLYMV